jgi:hypothetical protein
MLAISPIDVRVLERIRAEYEESPGLSLTERQARRLWGLDEKTCSTLLKELVEEHYLQRTAAETYIRVNLEG